MRISYSASGELQRIPVSQGKRRRRKKREPVLQEIQRLQFSALVKELRKAEGDRDG